MCFVLLAAPLLFGPAGAREFGTSILASHQQSLDTANPRVTIAMWRSLVFRDRWLADAGVALMAALAATGAAAVVLHLWRADLHVPFAYSYDANFTEMLIKGTITHGSWFTNSSLGAPFGQQLYDFAVGGENLDLVIVRLLGLGSRDPALVMNLFYLLSFPLSAASAYLVMRWAGLSRPVAASCSVLYALLPYHFQRGENHLFLAADFAVPLGAYLVLGVLSDRPVFARSVSRGAVGSYLNWRTLVTVLACVVVASAGDGFYYAVFTLVLVIIAAVVSVAARRNRAPLAVGTTIVALIIAAGAANLAPTLAYASSHGRNYLVALRHPNESETFGLKLTELLLPVNGHRLRAFAHLKQVYGASATPHVPNEVYDASLGSLGSLGFVWLLLVLAASALGFRLRPPQLIRDSRPVAVAAVAAFLLGSTGGLSALIAYVLTPQIRSWNRLSIFIAFFSLLALGLLLDCIRRKLRGGRRSWMLFLAALAAVVVLGVADQTTSSDVPRYGLVASLYHADARYISGIESRLPHGAMVLELPYQPFPEATNYGRVHDYELVRPYLHSRFLRWSYGAMKGRPEDWEEFLAEKPLSEVVAGAAAAGFAGLYLDPAGYPREARRLETVLSTLLGVRPLVERGQKAFFFDLRPFARRLRSQQGTLEIAALREATLNPPRIEPRGGISPEEDLSPTGKQSWWVTSHRSEVDLYEPVATQSVVFKAELLNNPGPYARARPAHVWITWPDGSTTSVGANRDGVTLVHGLRLQHGDNLVRIKTDAEPIYAPSDERTLYLQLFDVRFGEQAFLPFARGFGSSLSAGR